MILANGASYDLKERVMLRELSLEMRVEVGKRQQGRERARLIVEFGHKSGSEQKPNCSRMCQRSRPLHTFYEVGSFRGYRGVPVAPPRNAKLSNLPLVV
jgi:hypothetical protein